MDSREIHIYHADAGAGKTRKLMDIIASHVEAGIPLHRIAFVTYTRAAAEVAKQRVCERFGVNIKEAPHFRTIHSMCFQRTGAKANLIMDNSKYLDFGKKAGYEFSAYVGSRDLDSVDWQHLRDDEIVSFEQLYRNHPNKAQWILDNKIDNLDFVRYCQEYVKYKRTFGYVDFTDLLEKYIEDDYFEDVDVACIDEAQDCTPLQWKVLFKAFRKAKYIYIVGDEKQCQPGDEQVLCRKNTGYNNQFHKDEFYYKRLDQLDPQQDELVSMTRPQKGREWHFTRGHKFQVEHHHYKGDLYVVRTEKEVHKYTPTHRCIVRTFIDDSVKGKWCVYLMRRGKDYKIGITGMTGSSCPREFGPLVRMRQEGADGLWILRVCNKDEALAYEMLYSYQYGIPQAVFAEKKNDWLYAQIDTYNRAAKLLDEMKWDIKYPAYYRDSHQPIEENDRAKDNDFGGILQMYAMYLNPLYMNLVQYRKTDRNQKGCGYTSFSVSSEKYDGEVYSLNVESSTHTYVNGELVTHNCIYEYNGAEPRILLDMKGVQHTMEKSYRVPRNINEFVKKHIVCDMEDITPTNLLSEHEGGMVKYITTLDELPSIDLGKSYLFLCRNRKFFATWEQWCQRNCIPYSIKNKPLFSNEEKMQFRDGLIQTWEPNRLALAQRYYAKRTFYEQPVVRIDTIHGVKGDEADIVVLLSDISRLTWKELEENPTSEHRVFYVGCTRARETLYIVSPATKYYYSYLF